MKKILLILGFMVTAALSSAETTQCNFDKQLGSTISDRLSTIREKTANTCLNCESDSCSLKIWPTKQKGDAMVCQRLFCTLFKI